MPGPISHINICFCFSAFRPICCTEREFKHEQFRHINFPSHPIPVRYTTYLNVSFGTKQQCKSIKLSKLTKIRSYSCSWLLVCFYQANTHTNEISLVRYVSKSSNEKYVDRQIYLRHAISFKVRLCGKLSTYSETASV